MSDTDPFQPQATAPGDDPATAPDITSTWSAALGDPGVRAALLQGGLSLMQPASFGQTGPGQLAQAIGAGAEAYGRQDTENTKDALANRGMSVKEQEADSRDEKRGADATIAEGRLRATEADNQSRDILRRAQAERTINAKKLDDARVSQIEAKIAADPENQALKNDLLRARADQARSTAEFNATRTELAPTETETRQRRAATGEQNATTRAGGLELKKSQDANPLTQRFKAQAEYRKGVGLYSEYTKTLLPGQKATPINEWLKIQGLPTSPSEVGVPAQPLTPTAPSPQTAAPMNIDVARETQLAKQNILKNPAREQQIRAIYKQRTGQELQ